MLTPPRGAPGTEASTGGTGGGAAGTAGGNQGAAAARGQRGAQTGQEAQSGAANGPGSLNGAQPTPRQAELMRKSERINRTVMRSICIGCEGAAARRERQGAPARVDVQAPLSR